MKHLTQIALLVAILIITSSSFGCGPESDQTATAAPQQTKATNDTKQSSSVDEQVRGAVTQVMTSRQNPVTPTASPVRAQDDVMALTREKAAKAIAAQYVGYVARRWSFSVDVVINPTDVGVLERQGYIICQTLHGPCTLTDKGTHAAAGWKVTRNHKGEIEWLDIPVGRVEVVGVSGITTPINPTLADVTFMWHVVPMNEIGKELYALHSRPDDQDRWDTGPQNRTATFQRFDDGWRVVNY